MKLIAGLGNPGAKYERTRHNAGFMAVDHLLSRYGIAVTGAKFGAPFVTASVRGVPTAFIKPMAYMNLSGGPIREAMTFFKIQPSELLVIHDDIDLAPGVVRHKTSGGHAGHNGLRSIMSEIGTPDFDRIRIGVGRPPAGMNAADYVLARFTAEEAESLPEIFEKALELVDKNFLK